MDLENRWRIGHGPFSLAHNEKPLVVFSLCTRSYWPSKHELIVGDSFLSFFTLYVMRDQVVDNFFGQLLFFLLCLLTVVWMAERWRWAFFKTWIFFASRPTHTRLCPKTHSSSLSPCHREVSWPDGLDITKARSPTERALSHLFPHGAVVNICSARSGRLFNFNKNIVVVCQFRLVFKKPQ